MTLYDSGASSASWMYEVRDTNRFEYRRKYSGYLTAGFIITDTNWHHVATTRNAGTGIITFYLDGVVTNSGTSVLPQAPAGTKLIGAMNNTIDQFHGSIDDFVLYDRPLSTSEIAQLINR